MKYLVILLLVLYVFVLIKMLKTLREKSVILLGIILHSILAIASIIYIETGSYVIELDAYTYETGATWKLIMYFIIFFIFITVLSRVIKFSDTHVEKPTKKYEKIVYKYIIPFGYALLAYNLINLIISGIPLFSNEITRFNFYSMYSRFPLASKVHTVIVLYLPPILVMSIFNTYGKMRKKAAWLLIFMIFIYMIMSGFKMSGIRDLAINVAIPLVILCKIDFGKIRNLFKPKVIISGAVIIGVFTGIYYYNIVNTSNKDPWNAMEERAFALTSHLWWATEADNFNGNSLFPRKDSEEWLSVLENRSEYDMDSGIVKLMNKYGVDAIVQSYLSSNVRFATNFITTAVYNFGYIGAICHIFFISCCLVIFIHLFANSIKNKNLIFVVVVYKLYALFVEYIAATATLTTFFNYEYLVIFLCTIFYSLYKSNFKITLIRWHSS